MSSKQFIPLTPPIGIPGSSYSIQIGVIDGVYHVKIKRGDTVVDIVKIYTLDINEITAIVYSSMKLPMFNMFSIMRAVGRALNALEENIEKRPYSEPIPVEKSSMETPREVRTDIQNLPQTQEVSQEFKTMEKPKTFEKMVEIARKKPVDEYPVKKTIERISIDEKWTRAVATIDLILSIIGNFLKERYGENVVKDFWDYLSNVVSNLWKKAELHSFEEKIVNIVHWLESQGISFSEINMEANSFEGKVKDCLFKKRADALKNINISLPYNFPCGICWLQLSKICDALDLTLKLDKIDNECTFVISEKGEKKGLVL
ncbi:MAG: hypothetical protein J7L07_10485 [Candidatus Odinarchaeota archaeon]|nr:hypothetical protein [Candidatus Odinarchaeota archaeon]